VKEVLGYGNKSNVNPPFLKYFYDNCDGKRIVNIFVTKKKMQLPKVHGKENKKKNIFKKIGEKKEYPSVIFYKKYHLTS
jgi:hypothetical protein